MDEDKYLITPTTVFPSLPPLDSRGNRFSGWRCVVVLEDEATKAIYTRILRAGGAAVVDWTLKSLSSTLLPSSDDAPTHVFSEPAMKDKLGYFKFFKSWREKKESNGIASYVYVGECLIKVLPSTYVNNSLIGVGSNIYLLYILQETNPSVSLFSIWNEPVVRLHVEIRATEKRRQQAKIRKKRKAAAAATMAAHNSDDDVAEDEEMDGFLLRNQSQHLAPDAVVLGKA